MSAAMRVPPPPYLAKHVKDFSPSEGRILLLFLLHPEFLGEDPVSIAFLAQEAGLSWRATQAALLSLETKHRCLRRRPLGSLGTSYEWTPKGKPSSAAAKQKKPRQAAPTTAS